MENSKVIKKVNINGHFSAAAKKTAAANLGKSVTNNSGLLKAAVIQFARLGGCSLNEYFSQKTNVPQDGLQKFLNNLPFAAFDFNAINKRSDYWKYSDPLVFQNTVEMLEELAKELGSEKVGKPVVQGAASHDGVEDETSRLEELLPHHKELLARFADDWKIVFYNGCFQPQYSNVGEGISLYREVLAAGRGNVFEKLLSAFDDSSVANSRLGEANALAALMLSYCTEGITLTVTGKPKKKLHLFYFSSGTTNVVPISVFIDITKNSELTLVEHGVEANGFSPICLGFSLGYKASLRGLLLQGNLQEKVAKQNSSGGGKKVVGTLVNKGAVNYRWAHYWQSKGSSVQLHYSQVSSRSTLTQAKAILNGEGATFNCHGFSALGGDARLDNILEVRHLSPQSYSQQSFKSVGSGHSNTSSTSLVYVKKNAQLVNSGQLFKGLLLENSTRIKLRPQLEIYADDVKCGHGATVGPLSGEDMFYLQSRGIHKELAKYFLITAFIEDFFSKLLAVFAVDDKNVSLSESDKQLVKIITAIKQDSLFF